MRDRLLYAPMLALVALLLPSSAAAVSCPSAIKTQLTMSDGVRLSAGYLGPQKASGPAPLLVMQSGWGSVWDLYSVDACWASQRGYAVLMYTARGFIDSADGGLSSGGEIDVAGPRTVRDMSEVIDAALKLRFPAAAAGEVPVDARRIGVLAQSYGAGVGLLAAARDPRIRAVGAMHPWTDLVQAMYPNTTRKLQALTLLYVGSLLRGRPSAELTERVLDAWANRRTDKLVAYGAVRGASVQLAQLNRSRPALFLHAGTEDVLFDANQVRDFYARYEGPKRLETETGEHPLGGSGSTLAQQRPKWVRGLDWMDRHLRGTSTSGGAPEGVRVDPIGPVPAEEHRSLAELAPKRETLTFGPRTGPEGGVLATGPQPRWRWTINGGWSSTVESPLAFLGGALEQALDQKILVQPRWHINQRQAGVWTGAPYPNGLKLRGAPVISGSWATNRTDQATMIAYLFETDPWGQIRLISRAPWTDRAMTAGVMKPFRFELSELTYDVKPGHALTIVIDTTDWQYMDQTPAGATLTFRGTRENPWTLTLPTR